ncbi:MAG: response regulator [Pseudomonadota bacterium]
MSGVLFPEPAPRARGGRLSVTVQLMLLAVLPMAVLFVALTLFYAHHRNTLLDAQFDARVHDLSRALATGASQSLLSGDRESLDALAREMMRESNIHGLRIADDLGDALVKQGAAPAQLPSGALREVFIPLCIPLPGRDEYQRIGEVWVWFDQRDVQSSKRSSLWWSLMLAVSLAVLVAWVAWRLANRILRPMREALQAMERMGQGVGGVRVPEDADNELRQLQRGVNLLADALENQDHLREQALSLDLARERAEQAKKVRTLFLAHMSHEIRTPLNALVGFMHLLRREMAGQATTLRGEQYLEAMHQSAHHLSDLVADILDFSRIESGKLQMRTQPFSLKRLMDEVAVELAERARAKGLFIDVVCFLDIPDQISSDSLRLRQVLSNLLSNAIKFCPQGGVIIRAMLEQPADEQGLGCVLCFEVEDSGPGIPVEARDRLLEPFEQVEMGTRRAHEGTGLGLSICRGLVEQAGGRLSIEEGTALGGALLRFTWPVGHAVAEPELPRLPVAAVIVDDRPSFRQGAYSRLSRLGWVIRALEGVLRPETVESTLAHVPPDQRVLVLRDPVEHGAAGREALLAMVREAPSKVRHVLVCTARDEPAWERRIEMLGAVVIRCPATQRDLERAVDALGDTPFYSARQAIDELSSEGSFDGRTVLVVDDHPLNREVLAQMLELGGIRVLQAEGGEEALALVARECVDAILLDLHMPGMDGETVLQRLRERYPAIPVLMLTADAVSETAERLLRRGARDVLHKPVGETQLMHALAHVLGGMAPELAASPSWAGLRDRFWTQEWTVFEQRLQSAREAEDTQALREVLHTLAGTASMVGLLELASVARHLEEHWQGGVSSREDGLVWHELQRCVEKGRRL